MPVVPAPLSLQSFCFAQGETKRISTLSGLINSLQLFWRELARPYSTQTAKEPIVLGSTAIKYLGGMQCIPPFSCKISPALP